jgi:hypothetical protein
MKTTDKHIHLGVWTDENEKRSNELWPVFASSISTSTSAK